MIINYRGFVVSCEQALISAGPSEGAAEATPARQAAGRHPPSPALGAKPSSGVSPRRAHHTAASPQRQRKKKKKTHGREALAFHFSCTCVNPLAGFFLLARSAPIMPEIRASAMPGGTSLFWQRVASTQFTRLQQFPKASYLGPFSFGESTVSRQAVFRPREVALLKRPSKAPRPEDRP